MQLGGALSIPPWCEGKALSRERFRSSKVDSCGPHLTPPDPGPPSHVPGIIFSSVFSFLLDFCTGLGTSVSPARNTLQCNPSSLVIGWITCSFSRDGVNDLHSSGGASHEQTAICTVDSSKSSTWVRYSSSTELYFILRNESHGAQPWASDRLF